MISLLARLQFAVFSALMAIDWTYILATEVTIDVAAIVTAVGTAIAVVISAITLWLVRMTHNEVRTGNNLRMGEGFDLEESRRIKALTDTGQPTTAQEDEHVAIIDAKEAKDTAKEKEV